MLRFEAQRQVFQACMTFTLFFFSVTDVMNEGWLEDHLGLLSNLYITLMQGEVDRYQDTVRMLKDYYKGMEGKIPEELSGEYARIPLIEVKGYNVEKITPSN